MAKRVRIHWWTPSVMLLSFISGLLLALGHHFFYNFLTNKPTSTGDYTVMGAQHPGQQLNIAIGTAFAFLVKAAFVLAVSTAYYQVFWKMAKQDSKIEKSPNLGRLDAAFSGTTSVISLFNAPMWCRYPLLFLMAATVWLIPIASIITPATLSVNLRENIPNSTMQQVPQIDFSNLNFVAGMPSIAGTNTISLYYTYNGPSQIAKQIAMGVAAQNAILPIAAPFPNSSWALDFNGPSLKCNPVSSTESLSFQENIAQYIQESSNCYTPATYLSWFPRFDVAQNKTFTEPYPQMAQGNASTLIFSDPESLFNTGTGNFSEITQDAIMYLAIMPNMLSVRRFTLSSTPSACDLMGPDNQVTSNNPLGPVGGNVTMLQCQLYNSTYSTKFNYINGAQTINIDLVEQETDSTVPVINFVRGAGSDGLGSGNCTTLNEVGVDGMDCDFDGSLLPQLSYQGLLQAFSMLITGNITLIPVTNGLLDSTSIRSTTLLNTKELYYLTDYALHVNTSDMRPDLQKALSESNMSDASGISRLHQATPSQSLQDAIETMFKNFTVSLMSSSVLQPNYSSAGAPPKIMVTQFTAQTVYVYAAYKLWAAYSVAGLVTLASVIIGILVILMNGASYSNAFSTVLRVARAAELSVEVKESDLDGKNPLPSYLARASVTISGGKNRGRTPNAKEDPIDPKDANARAPLLT